MSEKIGWTLNVQLEGGPRIAVSQTLSVDAYDMIAVAIPDSTSDKEVQLQPGGEGQVQFLAISSSKYDADLTYKVNDKTTTAIPLDALLLLMGDGGVGLLGEAPTSLFFSNATGEEAALQILIGRKATV